jgi:hypothetical protein
MGAYAMSKQFPNRQIKIKPLSEGIGLGTLKNQEVTRIVPEVVKTSVEVIQKAPELNVNIMAQAHAAYASKPFDTVLSSKPAHLDQIGVRHKAQAVYATHSVASEIRSRPTTKAYVASYRFIVGVGMDFFVGLISALLLAWSGIIAWNAGSTGAFTPIEAFDELIGYLQLIPVFASVAIVSCAGLMVHFLRKFS